MDKTQLLGQLEAQLRGLAHGANEARVAAAEEARAGATSKERRADTRVAIEYSLSLIHISEPTRLC